MQAEPPKKFLFDTNDFGEEALRRKIEAARRPTFSQEEMEASRQTGFEQGKTAGIRETLNSQEAQIRDVLQQVLLAADRLEQGETQRLAVFIEQASLLAVQGLVKTCPALLGVFAADHILTFARTVIAENVRAQNVTIHVSPLNVGRIGPRLEDMAKAMKRGACVLVPDAALNDMQCRFEWTGGGAEWDPASASGQLMARLMDNLPEHLRGAATVTAVDATPQTQHTEPHSTGDVP